MTQVQFLTMWWRWDHSLMFHSVSREIFLDFRQWVSSQKSCSTTYTTLKLHVTTSPTGPRCSTDVTSLTSWEQCVGRRTSVRRSWTASGGRRRRMRKIGGERSGGIKVCGKLIGGVPRLLCGQYELQDPENIESLVKHNIKYFHSCLNFTRLWN